MSAAFVQAEPVLPLEVVKGCLCQLVPDQEWLIAKVEAQLGWIRFPPVLIRAISGLRVEKYPLLYESERALWSIGALPFFESREEFRQFNADLEKATVEERGQFVQSLLGSIDECFDSLEIPRTKSELLRHARSFRRLSVLARVQN